VRRGYIAWPLRCCRATPQWQQATAAHHNDPEHHGRHAHRAYSMRHTSVSSLCLPAAPVPSPPLIFSHIFRSLLVRVCVVNTAAYLHPPREIVSLARGESLETHRPAPGDAESPLTPLLQRGKGSPGAQLMPQQKRDDLATGEGWGEGARRLRLLFCPHIPTFPRQGGRSKAPANARRSKFVGKD